MRPALAVVTPFMHGKNPNPPRPDRIAALARTSVVAITSPPEWGGELDPPVRSRALKPSGGFKPKNRVLAIATSNTADARRNAVAVSLDADGHITRFILAGKADVYHPPTGAVPASPKERPSRRTRDRLGDP
jgi:hypothetical protein